MKFKNITSKVINMNVENQWVAIEPDEFIELPEYVGARQTGLSGVFGKLVGKPVEYKPKEENPKEEKQKIKKFKSKDELKKMSKDELNDYAALIGYSEVKSSMLKSSMIRKILEFQENKNANDE